MIVRILVFATLILALCGGAWYVLRETPEKRILKLRAEAERCFFDDFGDMEKARDLNDKVLELLPDSTYDLVFRARLDERMGTAQGLRSAVETYDRVLAKGDSSSLGVAFLKARACRTLGLWEEARGTLLSIVDAFPFEAQVELGDLALASFSGVDALRRFTKASANAANDLERARAGEGLGDAYLLLALGASRSDASAVPGTGVPPAEAAQDPADALRESARDSFSSALDALKSAEMPSSADDANRRLLLILRLSEKLHRLQAKGQHPLQDGIDLVGAKRDKYSVVYKDVSADVLLRLGATRLQAADQESDAAVGGLAAERRKEAEQDFLQVLGTSVEAARGILADCAKGEGEGEAAKGPATGRERLDPRKKTCLDYLRHLITVSRVFLASPWHGRILDDPSPLALSTRFADVERLAGAEAAGVFSLITAFAKLRGGQAAQAESMLRAYVAGAEAPERPRATIDVAEQLFRLSPEPAACLPYLDAFAQEGGGPLDFLPKRMSILLGLRLRADTEAEATKRIDAALAAADQAAKSAKDRILVAATAFSVKGPDAAADILRRAIAADAGDATIRRALAEILRERSEAVGGAAAAPYRREALAEYTALLVKSPTESQEVVRYAALLLRKLEEVKEDPALEGVVAKLFPGAAGKDAGLVASSIGSFLAGQFEAALAGARSVGAAETFEPFLSFLRGSCHVGLAALLQRGMGKATEPGAREAALAAWRVHVGEARAEFRRQPSFPGSQVELASLELQEIPPGGEVPAKLLTAMQTLAESPEVEQGWFLVSRAHRKRFERLFRDPKAQESELRRVQASEQRALRLAIRRNPDFVPAYVALAETYLVDGSPSAGRTEDRRSFSPDWPRAVNVLLAVPAPDEQVVHLLAYAHEAQGQADKARPYLENLALLRPSAESYYRLLRVLVELKDPGVEIILAAGLPPVPANLDPGRQRRLLELRAGLDSLAEAKGMRILFDALREGVDEPRISDPATRANIRARLISRYGEALAAFEETKTTPPIILLNNLAWHLSEEEDQASREKAVSLAAHAREASGGPARMPDVADTYGWVLYRAGRLSEAERVLRELTGLRDAPVYRYHLARVLTDLRRYNEALEEVRKALGSSAPFPEEKEARELELKINEARRKVLGED